MENLKTVTFVTADEVAKILRVSKMTVYRLVRNKELEGIRIGRSVRISEASLRAYLRRPL